MRVSPSSTAGSWHAIAGPLSTSPDAFSGGTCAGVYGYASADEFRRARHTATLLQNGKVMFFGGVNAGGVSNRTFFYSEQTGWSCGKDRVDINGLRC